jgi:acetyl/propionyl-CoA carboxylase alpha subunit
LYLFINSKMIGMPDKKRALFQVKVNDFVFSFSQDEIDVANFLPLSDTKFHLLKEHRSVTAERCEEADFSKYQVLEIEGEKYSVQIMDELDQMLDTMGYSSDAGKQIKEIKAPMPGLVLQVHVAEGQQLKEGEKMLVLVAMKMENSILVHEDATIKHIAVSAGQAVEKGQLLVVLE